MDSDKKGIGERLKKFFKAQNIKSIEAAEVLGVTPPAVSGWVSEKNTLSVNVVEGLTKHYRLNPTWLILGTGNMLLNNTNEMTRVYDEFTMKDLADELKDSHKRLMVCQDKLIQMQERCLDCLKNKNGDEK